MNLVIQINIFHLLFLSYNFTHIFQNTAMEENKKNAIQQKHRIRQTKNKREIQIKC